MAAEKTMWSKPEMTALMRSKPEETVLAVCKIAGSSASPGNKNTGCLIPSCSVCSLTAVS